MLKTIRDACRLHQMVLSYSMTDQIENLLDLIGQESDGRVFFKKNYVTQGMEELLREGLKRLAGQSDQAVFELTQAMGGGKTHLMIALGLLAKNPEIRTEVVPELAQRFGHFRTNIVAFSGRNNPDHYIWGEIAEQLGRGDEFRKFHVNGPRAPGADEWKRLIGDEPTLIMLDELPPYLDNAATVQVAQGSLATVTTNALSNLLAAAMELPRTCIVISNLTSSYQGASRQLSSIIRDIRDETRRQARTITPVQLAGNEIYEILKKRLFTELPSADEIKKVADAFAELLKEAQAAGYVSASDAEQFAEEIRATYPFHPSIKHLIAMFKDNDGFRQTRGLMQFVSRLLQSVWERPQDDVFLVGAQHLDLKKDFARDEILRINNDLVSAVARDITDQGNAHAEQIDGTLKNDAATQVSNVLLVASLSRAVNAVSGLTRAEAVEYLLAPSHKAEEFAKAFDALRKSAWYLHPEGNETYCFKPTENLNKRIEREAERAPAHRIEKCLRERLQELFRPQNRNAYHDCLALPPLDEIKTSGNRTLLIINPDNRIPPEAIRQFYESITEKNNILVVSGHDSHLTDRVDEAMRELWATEKVEKEIPHNNPLYEEIIERKDDAESRFLQAVGGAFNYLFYPTKQGLANTRLTFKFGNESNSVEQQIDEVLASLNCGRKLALDLDERPDGYLAMAEQRLWANGERRISWRDVARRAMTEPVWPWMPGAKGMERLRGIALQQGRWRLGPDNYIEKGPFPQEKTAVNAVVQHYDDATGNATLELQPRHAGQHARIHYSQSPQVSKRDPAASSYDNFQTAAPYLYFLAVDPDGVHETGESYLWRNELTIRHQPRETFNGRKVELNVVPIAELRYTLDGSNPKHGTVYTEPFSVPTGEVTLLIYASAEKADKQVTFRIPPAGDNTFRIDPTRTAQLKKDARVQLDDTAKTFALINAFRDDQNTVFHGVRITVGEGDESIYVSFGSDRAVTARMIEAVINTIRESIGDDTAAVQVNIRGDSQFVNGDALQRFAEIGGIKLSNEMVLQ